jgi:hypothetical protein
MPIRTNARRRARFSTRIRQVGVDVTGARLGESDESFSIAGFLWYRALRLRMSMCISRAVRESESPVLRSGSRPC